MKLEIVKAIILICMWLVTAICCVIPIVIVRRARRVLDPYRHYYYELTISLLSCFGGGVFLGTCMLHLFPEVKEQVNNSLVAMKVKTDFPVAEFITVFGFLIVLVIEQMVLQWKENNPELEPLLGHSHDHESPRINEGSEEHDVRPHTYSVHQDPRSHSSFRSLLLLFALSIHSVFEGLAVGLQANVEDTMELFGPIMIHKILIAFTLSLNLVQSKLRKSATIQCILLFSTMAPFGVAIGIGITAAMIGPAVSVVSAVLQGIACGTFIYVTFFEIIPHELQSNGPRLLKLLFVILGFSAMCLAIGFLHES